MERAESTGYYAYPPMPSRRPPFDDTVQTVATISYPMQPQAFNTQYGAHNGEERQREYHYARREGASGRMGDEETSRTEAAGSFGYSTPFAPRTDPYDNPRSVTPVPSYQSAPTGTPVPSDGAATTDGTTPTPKRSKWNRNKASMVLESDEERELDEEEKAMLKRGMINWNELKSWRFWIRKEWIWWYIGGAILAVLVILMTLYHEQIVDWLHPIAIKLNQITCGWLIPVAVLIVLSIPPLFGAEIVEILCGLVYGLWIGFAIVAVGTFLGELLNFYMFRYMLRSRAEKMEKKNMNYGLLAYVVREGGLWMATLVRLSAIPGHFSTVVFSTCGLHVWYFIVATIISMPKHIVIVYLGTLLSANAKKDKTSKIIQNVVLAITFLITVLAAWWIWRKMKQARLPVWRMRRAELAAKGMDMSSLPTDPTGYAAKAQRYPLDNDKMEELDDSRDPILLNAEEPSRQSTSENGHNISYRREHDGTAVVYGGDDRGSASSSRSELAQLGGGRYAEADLGVQQYHAQVQDFPRPQPYQGAQPVHRVPSDATALYSNPSITSPRHQQAVVFPTPRPAALGVSNDRTALTRYSLSDPGVAV